MEMKFSFGADLPPDALTAEFTIPLGIGANAAFHAIRQVVFLTNRDSLTIWMSGTIHTIYSDDWM